MPESALYDSYKSRFAEAELMITQAARLHSALNIPSINQLRYSANHIIKSLYLTGDSRKVEIEKADNHCKRAIYDACESIILYYLERFSKFEDDYRRAQITVVIPNFVEFKKKARELVDFTKDVPPDKTDEDDTETYRIENYSVIRDQVPRLREILDTLDAARTELNKAMKFQLYQFIGILACVIAALIGLPTFIAFIKGLVCTYRPGSSP